MHFSAIALESAVSVPATSFIVSSCFFLHLFMSFSLVFISSEDKCMLIPSKDYTVSLSLACALKYTQFVYFHLT